MYCLSEINSILIDSLLKHVKLGFLNLSVIWYALGLGPQAGALQGVRSTSKFVFWLQTNEWLFDYWHTTQF